MCMKESNSIQVDTREVFRTQPTTSTSADERMDHSRAATSGSRKPIVSAFNLSMHPGFNTCRRDVLENEANFLPTSRVDVLTVSGSESTLGIANSLLASISRRMLTRVSAFHTDQDDAQVDAIINVYICHEICSIALTNQEPQLKHQQSGFDGYVRYIHSHHDRSSNLCLGI